MAEEADDPGDGGRVSEPAAAAPAEISRLMEWAPNAMILTGTDGIVLSANSRAEALFGFDRGAIAGSPVDGLIPERFRRLHGHHRASFGNAPSTRPMGVGHDLFALRKDGVEVPVVVELTPVPADGGVMALCSIVDISDHRQREEVIRGALREKEILLDEVHHRVKNNLQIVSSLLELLTTRVEDPLALEVLRDTQRRIQSMALIHRILYQSRDVVRVNFREFLDDLVPMLLSAYVADPLRISLSVGAVDVELPISSAIPSGLIVNELISNALKHAFPNGRAGSIQVDLLPVAGGRVMISVSDDGVGIADDRTLFEPDGRTLGLQLVTLLTDQLGGTLDVARRNPTRFQVTFPINR